MGQLARVADESGDLVQSVDVNAIVRDIAPLVARLASPASVSVELTAAPGHDRVAPSEIRALLLNHAASASKTDRANERLRIATEQAGAAVRILVTSEVASAAAPRTGAVGYPLGDSHEPEPGVAKPSAG